LEPVDKIVTYGGAVPPLGNVWTKPVISKALGGVKEGVLSQLKVEEISFRRRLGGGDLVGMMNGC
jgi:hypothetical protein